MDRPVAEVVRNERITPRMARITFTDPSFTDFPSVAYDHHVKLWFPPEGAAPVVPGPGPNGLDRPEGSPKRHTSIELCRTER
ncbi:Iron-chelator utilization protein [Devosia sp. LC5]|uniref:siderophore-interacting protein n=1 Tax=Devosia sp. LC5 TaxID=1502724 RepID=UPI0004E31ABD|nr:siderophore-interacting protein [Devosia sp. LC5]KFC71761.1 Iron-chelator utilization protein [Devosia sp. LC5]